MIYRLTLLLVCLLYSCKPESPSSPYAEKQGDIVYWAVVPNMDSSAFNTLSRELKAYKIGFKPTVERNKDGLLSRMVGTIIPFTQNEAPPDTLLVAQDIAPKLRPLWPGFAVVDIGNIPMPVLPVMLPLGFSYDAKTGVRTDLPIEQLPASIRAQVEKQYPPSVVDQMLKDNQQHIRQFNLSLSSGKPASAFQLIDSNGEKVRLSDFRGKVVYLDFWAHWCGPCMADMELLRQNYTKINQPDLVFLSVSVDEPQDRDIWLRTLHKRQFIGKHVLAEGGWKGKTARLYGIKEIPTSFIIGRDGNFFATKLTPLSFGGLESVIKELEAALAVTN